MKSTWLEGVSMAPPAAGWADRSLMAFSGPAHEGGLPPSISVSHDARNSPGDPRDEPFGAYVERQCDTLQASLPGFQNRQPSPLRTGTSKARDILFTWRSGAISLTQWVVWMAMPDGTVLTYTATSESSQFEAHRPLFEATLPRLQIDATAFPALA